MFNQDYSPTIYSFLFILLAMLSTACSYNPVIDKVPIPNSVLPPIDAKVGIYIKKDLNDFVYEEKPYYFNTVRLPIGKASASTLNKIGKNLFDECVRIKSSDSLTSISEDLDAVFIPSIKEFHLSMMVIPNVASFSGMIVQFRMVMVFNLVLKSPEGRLISEWEIASVQKNSLDNRNIWSSYYSVLEDMLRLSLRDFTAKMLVEYPNLPEITEWVKYIKEGDAN